MKVEVRKKEIEQKVYISDDGKEFANELMCLHYEECLDLQSKIDKAEELRIPTLDDLIPLDCSGCTNENSSYRWYKVNSTEDFKVVCEAYREVQWLKGKKINYPELICVETLYGEPYDVGGDFYLYLYSDVKKGIEEFNDGVKKFV